MSLIAKQWPEEVWAVNYENQSHTMMVMIQFTKIWSPAISMFQICTNQFCSFNSAHIFAILTT